MNILFCGDSHAEDGVLIATLSILKNYQKPLHFYVLTMTAKNVTKTFSPFSMQAIKVIEKQLKDINSESTIKLIDITDLYQKNPPRANQNTRFTPYALIRLYADEIPDLPDRLLYLDDDIIVRQSITDFYNQDLTNVEFVGVLDYYGRWFYHDEFKAFDYVNSGVLLLNMAEIKRTHLFKKVRHLIQTREMLLPDQAALNKLATEKRIAPRKFNEQHRLQPDTVIQHFTTSFRFFPYFHTVTIKPWDIDKVHNTLKIHEYDDILNKYLELKPELKKGDSSK